jgi:hypothetical protein
MSAPRPEGRSAMRFDLQFDLQGANFQHIDYQSSTRGLPSTAV